MKINDIQFLIIVVVVLVILFVFSGYTLRCSFSERFSSYSTSSDGGNILQGNVSENKLIASGGHGSPGTSIASGGHGSRNLKGIDCARWYAPGDKELCWCVADDDLCKMCALDGDCGTFANEQIKQFGRAGGCGDYVGTQACSEEAIAARASAPPRCVASKHHSCRDFQNMCGVWTDLCGAADTCGCCKKACGKDEVCVEHCKRCLDIVGDC